MSMMDGYVFVNMIGGIIDSNAAYQEMVGYSADELSRLTYDEITPIKWRQLEEEIIRDQILPMGHSMVYHKEYIKKNGIVFPVELRTFLIRSASGENEGMWAIVRDITKRMQAEESLRKSEEKFRSIVESSPTAMYFYHLEPDNRLVMTGANPATDLIIGISNQVLIGKSIEEAFPNLVNTEIPDIYRKVAHGDTGPQSFEIDYQDERFSGFYYVHVFKTGPNEIAVDFIDISHRRKIEEALRRSQIEYMDTLDSLPDWIYVVDEQYKIAMVNAALKEEIRRHGLEPECIGVEIVPNFPFISTTTLDEIKLVFNTGVVSVNKKSI
jgi:PAS domain S-box-containing protein